jgi:hypothetical protein
LRQRLHSRVKDEDFSSIAHAATAEPRIRNAANCSPPVEKCRQRVVDDFFIEWMFEAINGSGWRYWNATTAAVFRARWVLCRRASNTSRRPVVDCEYCGFRTFSQEVRPSLR